MEVRALAAVKRGAPRTIGVAGQWPVVIQEERDTAQRFDPEHIQRAATDMLGLAVLADALVTSSLSTFGYVAAALFPKPARSSKGGDKAAVWVVPYGSSRGPPRADTQEPCMHFYQRDTGSCKLVEREPGLCTAPKGRAKLPPLEPSADRKVC
eukprot:CAMPEP_0172644744 /NCGR_PEP_ID=MMETSP1068-20121228/239369_1 /TAXON_ID=35684 /ORGANISM="Pseudopedinella elastica, Strain CCMP716" /LENGTH=152 /DNA_ID=CAMNT_0013458953 /DNA_START=276 /DNA_END=734 /DNA_ORIENTATION=-